MEISGFKSLRIGSLIARVPIVQGGMGVGISLSGLAAATANAGGIGVIAAAGIGLLEPDGVQNFLEANIRGLRREIRRARELTRESRGILGVNIMVALTDFAALVRTAIEEKIDIIFAGAGLPVNLPEYLVEGAHTMLVPIVSSGRAAVLLAKRWLDKYGYRADAIVVEGPKAGGHLGFKREQIEDPAYALERLVPEVVEAILPFAGEHGPIPVIAGGGVYTGADIRTILDLGASGVQMATRFVATEECDASPDFKQTYLDAREGDLEIISSPVGMPGRAIHNGFLEAVAQGAKAPYSCPYHCIVTCDPAKAPYCISLALRNAQMGRLGSGFAFAGANAWRVDRLVKVKDLVDELEAEYSKARN